MDSGIFDDSYANPSMTGFYQKSIFIFSVDSLGHIPVKYFDLSLFPSNKKNSG